MPATRTTPAAATSETFTIDQAASMTTVTCPTNVTYTGPAQTPCTANVTGAGGLNQTLTVSYANNINAGTATANASYAGDANHTASSDSETFTIDQAASTTTVTCPAGPFTYNGIGADAVHGECDGGRRAEPGADGELLEQHQRRDRDGQRQLCRRCQPHQQLGQRHLHDRPGGLDDDVTCPAGRSPTTVWRRRPAPRP